MLKEILAYEGTPHKVGQAGGRGRESFSHVPGKVKGRAPLSLYHIQQRLYSTLVNSPTRITWNHKSFSHHHPLTTSTNTKVRTCPHRSRRAIHKMQPSYYWNSPEDNLTTSEEGSRRTTHRTQHIRQVRIYIQEPAYEPLHVNYNSSLRTSKRTCNEKETSNHKAPSLRNCGHSCGRSYRSRLPFPSAPQPLLSHALYSSPRMHTLTRRQ